MLIGKLNSSERALVKTSVLCHKKCAESSSMPAALEILILVIIFKIFSSKTLLLKVTGIIMYSRFQIILVWRIWGN